MNGFSESWLVEHQRKIAQGRAAPVCATHAPPAPGALSFSLPKIMPSANKMLHLHHIKRWEYAKSLSSEVAAAIGWDWLAGHEPWERARVSITRRTLQLLDPDAQGTAAKVLIDTLLKRSTTHPWGLGVLVDDSPDRMALVLRQVRVAHRAEMGTDVSVERMD